MIIAVDGPAASGKGTLARRLAGTYKLAYLDSGALYRTVAMVLLNEDNDPSNETACIAAAKGLTLSAVISEDLRSDRVAKAASTVAAIPAVRRVLLDLQQGFAQEPGIGFAGAIIDGRDIGTVVCPNADIKIFVTAGIEVRVRRRVKELRERGEDAIEARVLAEMSERDKRDSTRSIAPLVPAADAWILDTSELDADGAFETAKTHIDKYSRI